MSQFLITGGNGNLGYLVAEKLNSCGHNVIRFDLADNARPGPGIELVGDLRDTALLGDIFRKHAPDGVIHLASLLSGSSEDDLDTSWEINATASFRLLRLAQDYALPGPFVFASTIASYGGLLQDPLPENAEQWPDGMYGATKVAVERLGHYFHGKHGLDFRCLRFPLVLSPFAPPSALTAYPSHAFRAAAAGKAFTFPVSRDVGMSTLYLDDVVRSLVEITEADRDALSRPAYNLHGFYVSAGEIEQAVRKIWPDFRCRYQPVAAVETMLANMPDNVIDTTARQDWGWRPQFDFQKTAAAMAKLLGVTEGVMT